MTVLIVFEAGDERIFPIEHARAGRNVLGDALEIVGLESAFAWSEIRFRIDHQLGKIGFVERFDARGQRRVAQYQDRRAVLARDPRGFDRNVETIFHRRGGEDDARTVTVTPEDRLMQIALLDVGRQAGTGAAALNITNDDWNL